MITRLIYFITIFFIIGWSNYGLCEIYKWRNDDGTIGVTDNIGNIPEKYRDQVEIINYEDNSVKESISDQKANDQLTNDELEKIREFIFKAESPQTKQEIESEIVSLWNNFRAALSRGDFNAALSYIAIEARERYRYNFELFGSEKLKAISSDLKDFENCGEIEPNARFVECEQITMGEGRQIASPIQFARDLDGIWRIYFF